MSINLGFSATQALSTAYSESTSLSETVSTSSSASVTLPPYTEIGIKQSTSNVEQSFEYSCPVYVTYKVAIFGINAQYLHDFGTGSWNVVDYDQGSICVGFGCKDSLGGISAVENLYNRVNADSTAFEVSYGNVSGMYKDQEDGHDTKQITYLDWNSPEVKYPGKVDYDLKDLAAKAKNNIPMSSMGGKMLINTESINTDLTPIYPLYDLERIRFEGSGAYNLAIGGNLDLNMVNVVGLNKFDQPYYGFLGRMGTWQLCDVNGNDLPDYDDGKGISITATPSSQIITANELGDYYLRFDIDEEYYTKAADRKTYITNDDLEMTAIMKLSVTDTGNNHTCRAGAWVSYIPSNCLVEGERYKYCLTCSKRMAVEVIPKADHIPVEIIEAPTCTKDGSKTVSCATCQSILGHEVIPAKKHGSTYEVTTVTPTCTRDGEKAVYCYDCNTLVDSLKIEATGHDEGVWKVDFEATPEHDGQMTRYCSSCNKALENKLFEYHRHSYSAWTIYDNINHIRYCEGCDASETAAHIFGEYVSNDDGTKTAECVLCSATDTVTDEDSKTETDTDTKPMSFIDKLIAFLRNLFKNLFDLFS